MFTVATELIYLFSFLITELDVHTCLQAKGVLVPNTVN